MTNLDRINAMNFKESFDNIMNAIQNNQIEYKIDNAGINQVNNESVVRYVISHSNILNVPKYPIITYDWLHLPTTITKEVLLNLEYDTNKELIDFVSKSLTKPNPTIDKYIQADVTRNEAFVIVSFQF